MRLHEIGEPKKKPTKTKQQDKTDFGGFAQEPENKGNLTPHNEPAGKKTKDMSKLPGEKKSKSATRTTNFGSNLPHGAGNVFNNFMNQVGDMQDEVPDNDFDIDDLINSHMGDDNAIGMEPTPPTEKKIENLPAVVSRDLMTQGFNDKAVIQWHELKHLPGYALNQIRAAFRPLFRDLMGAELENVMVATTLDPSQPKGDFKKLVGFIAANGDKMDDFNLEAFNIDPDQYAIDQAMVYDLGAFRFLILKEHLMGSENYYIYTSAKPQGKALGTGSRSKQLR